MLFNIVPFFFFFFSSRRRHTRWNCDWSSDVCSSDLEAGRATAEIERLTGAGRAASAEQDRLEIALGEGRARELTATARLGDLTREVERLREEVGRATGAGRERDADMATLAARLESLAAERDRL